MKVDPRVVEKEITERLPKTYFCAIVELILEVFSVIFSGTILGPKNGTPGWSRMWQEAARIRPEFGSVQEFPPFVQISCRNLRRMSCRKGLETPLAAGLAAGAGGLDSFQSPCN